MPYLVAAQQLDAVRADTGRAGCPTAVDDLKNTAKTTPTIKYNNNNSTVDSCWNLKQKRGARAVRTHSMSVLLCESSGAESVLHEHHGREIPSLTTSIYVFV